MLFVPLTPGTDYVLALPGLAGDARDRLPAATPILMLGQLLLLPGYLWLFLRAIEIASFGAAFLLLIVIPLPAAFDLAPPVVVPQALVELVIMGSSSACCHVCFPNAVSGQDQTAGAEPQGARTRPAAPESARSRTTYFRRSRRSWATASISRGSSSTRLMPMASASSRSASWGLRARTGPCM